ncbi:hypothetical protein [Mameliella sp. AT18]|uniref:hypothetical protein n=1 Tax=Mameliella sp. AT18 TaxID=3028385 RepID=UPI00237AE094|nr:hypothetical protein [Mameliella sp. AT18]
MAGAKDDRTIDAGDEADLAPESMPWGFVTNQRDELRCCGCDADNPLGMQPDLTLEVLRDLGLNDDEIARYFGMSTYRISACLHDGEMSDQSLQFRELAWRMRARLCGKLGR